MNKRLRILELIEAGEISAAEGVQRLEALAWESERSEEDGATVAPAQPAPRAARPVVAHVAWQATFWTGVALAAGGGLLVSSAYGRGVSPGWLPWSWALFILGVIVTLIGWWMRRARWLSVRVQEEGGPRIAFALPLPLGLAGWALRAARPFVPQLQEAGMDELVLAMREELRSGSPLVIEVNDEEDGDHVEVVFG